MSINEIIRKHALKNASDYEKANAGPIVGKVIAEFPDAKKNMKETMKLINGEIGKINQMQKSEIESELKNYTFAEKKIEEKKLVLRNAEMGKVVTRFAPEPSGYPHIGHAKALLLEYNAAKEYAGKMNLRFDDTNPEKESQEYVDALKEGIIWFGISWEKESYASDGMQLLYGFAEKAFKKGAIYVCTCTQEQTSENRTKGNACPCSQLSAKEQLARWKKMHDGYKQGEATVRLKGDMKSLNTVMRDPTLFRILDAEHYRQGKKYCVWPTYDFEAPIMDSVEGITHMMRSKEYELRDELYVHVLDMLELRKPEIFDFSRLAIKNAPISKRLITPLVKEGKVLGWDDPRLPTLKGLARRGILPEAIKKFVLSFGLSKVESEPGWEKLLSENRKLLEPNAKHYFFVPDPVKLKIRNAKPKEAELKLHPSQNFGTRKISVSDFVYIPKDDFDRISEGEIFRLKDLYNVKMLSKENCEVEFAGDGMVEKKLQWATDYIETEVLKPRDLLNEDGTYNEKSLEIARGYAEKNISGLKEGEVIQFERFGFCRLDRKNPYIFVYSC